MPRYLLHVGPHKTGTTYLQLRFDAARERLRERGVLYPAELSASRMESSHRKLFLEVRASNISYLRFMFEQIARTGPEYVLISSEDLNHLDQRELGSLRDAIGGWPATVVFYCRRWSEVLPSLWQERVKHGHDETFPEFFSANISEPLASHVMNFAYSLDRYASAFGKENIRIVSYSNVCDDGLDLAEHFFDAFLPQHQSVLDGLPPLANARPNQSFAAVDIEVIRVLNSLHIQNGGERNAELRDWYMAHARTFDLSELFSAIGSNIAALRFSDASSAVVRLHDEVLGAYAGVLVDPVRKGCLFEAGTSDIRVVQPRYLTNRGARAALDKVYAAFLEASCRASGDLPAD